MVALEATSPWGSGNGKSNATTTPQETTSTVAPFGGSPGRNLSACSNLESKVSQRLCFPREGGGWFGVNKRGGGGGRGGVWFWGERTWEKGGKVKKTKKTCSSSVGKSEVRRGERLGEKECAGTQ